MILNDFEIIRRCNEPGVPPMISPFIPTQVKNQGELKLISYGLSSFGYDVAMGHEAKIFTNHRGGEINPKAVHADNFQNAHAHVDKNGTYFIIPPNGYLLTHTLESFNIPRDVMVVAVGKSTYARAGIIVNVTPIEPGFRGQVVIEVANATSLPARVYIGEGISQFLFFKGEPCTYSYQDKQGKYQDQKGITDAKV